MFLGCEKREKKLIFRYFCAVLPRSKHMKPASIAGFVVFGCENVVFGIWRAFLIEYLFWEPGYGRIVIGIG